MTEKMNDLCEYRTFCAYSGYCTPAPYCGGGRHFIPWLALNGPHTQETVLKFDAIASGVYPELIYPPYKSTLKRGPTQPLLRIARR